MESLSTSWVLSALLLGMLHSCLSLDTPAVALYMSESQGVLDLSWDSAPNQLAQQLVDLGLMVEMAVGGQPRLSGSGAPAAYVIPVQNGHTFYSSAEDMGELSNFVAQGGLIVILDASTGEGAALRSFVSRALKLTGSWSLCKRTGTTDTQGRFGRSGLSVLSDFAPAFLPGAALAGSMDWPENLEDARIISTYTRCQHQDSSTIIRPLYSLADSNTQVIAQAFGKVGSPGAVVWLGYSWKDGPQEGWGHLLLKLITDFANGAYQPSMFADTNPSDSFDDVLEDTMRLREDTRDEIIRRVLAAPSVYGSKGNSGNSNNMGSGNSNGNVNGNGNGNGNGDGVSNPNKNPNSNGGHGRTLVDTEDIDEIMRRFMSAAPGAYPPSGPNSNGNKGGNKNTGESSGNNGNGNGARNGQPGKGVARVLTEGQVDDMEALLSRRTMVSVPSYGGNGHGNSNGNNNGNKNGNSNGNNGNNGGNSGKGGRALSEDETIGELIRRFLSAAPAVYPPPGWKPNNNKDGSTNTGNSNGNNGNGNGSLNGHPGNGVGRVLAEGSEDDVEQLLLRRAMASVPSYGSGNHGNGIGSSGNEKNGSNGVGNGNSPGSKGNGGGKKASGPAA